jgi:hypothetical protein
MTESQLPAFLRRYLSHAEVSNLVQGWAQEHPEFVRLKSIGKSLQGRELWLLELGTRPDEARPAVWVDGNMHALELLGSNIALGIAASVIDLHRGALEQTLPRPIQEAARRALFYVLPRVSPDGAEEVLNAGRLSRSAPRDRRARKGFPRWVRADVDGDGAIRQLRRAHPAGGFVGHPECRDVMVPRRLGDEGPFFNVYPEGYIEDFDGRNIPAPSSLSDNDTDFNRNFPHGWTGAADGGGAFPGSDPEPRALMEFASNAPHIFSWVNLHTFGGVFIRPPFSGPGALLHQDDLQVYENFAEVIRTLTGMTTVSAFEEMTPDKASPMTGTLASWAHVERGCLSWAVELWDLFAAAGLERRTPFFRNYSLQDRDAVKALVTWDAAENQQRAFSAWRAFKHPQLGEIEVGGVEAVRGISNPPETHIPAIARKMSAFAMTLAAMAPRLEARVQVEPLSGSLRRIRLTLSNSGYLPTYVMASSREKSWNDPIRVITRATGCRMLSGSAATEVGHLAGWGHDDGRESGGVLFQRSSGVQDAEIEWVVEGHGSLDLEIGSPRVGWQRVRAGEG